MHQNDVDIMAMIHKAIANYAQYDPQAPRYLYIASDLKGRIGDLPGVEIIVDPRMPDGEAVLTMQRMDDDDAL